MTSRAHNSSNLGETRTLIALRQYLARNVAASNNMNSIVASVKTSRLSEPGAILKVAQPIVSDRESNALCMSSRSARAAPALEPAAQQVSNNH